MKARRREEWRLGIAQLAARLGVSGRTVSRWCVAGTFPPFHYIGTHRKWLLRDVEAWEAAHRGPPPELEARIANLRSPGASASDLRTL